MNTQSSFFRHKPNIIFFNFFNFLNFFNFFNFFNFLNFFNKIQYEQQGNDA